MDGLGAGQVALLENLRFNAGEDLQWGLNINRWVPSVNEDSYLVLIPRGEAGWSSRMADLVGLESIPPSRRIEVMPYVASSATYAASSPWVRRGSGPWPGTWSCSPRGTRTLRSVVLVIVVVPVSPGR